MFKLIKNPFGYYLYDARVNRVIEVSERFYQAYSEENFEVLEALPEYRKMLADRFFDKSDFEIRQTNDEFRNVLYERGIHSMVLQVTQNCNFRCEYCPYTSNTGNVRIHSDKTMSLEVAMKAVDFLHEHSIDAKDVVISFYGGEPLLQYKTIQKIMEYAKEIFEGKSLGFSMTTNATLLTEEIMAYFNENKMALTISLDGTKEVNDAHRVFAEGTRSTFDVIISKMQLIAEKYPALKDRTVINTVVDPTKDYMDYWNLYENPIIKGNFTINGQSLDSTDLNETYEVSDEFVEKFNYFCFIDMIKESRVSPDVDYRGLFNILNREDRYKALEGSPIVTVGYPGGPCIPGHMKLFVDVDGRFFPCEKVSELNEAMHIGNLEDGFDMKKCDALINMPRITAEECKNCWAFRLCNSCHVYACDKNGLSKEKRLAYCREAKLAAENQLRRYVIENRKKMRVYM